MKCPYAVHRITRTETKFNYNQENIETSQTTTEINKADFCECLKEECGVYYNDRCNYSQR